MALTLTNIGQSPRVDHLQKGMEVRHVAMTYSVAGDYGTTNGNRGFQLQAIAQKLGFRRIFAVLQASVISGNNTVANEPTGSTRKVWALWAPGDGPAATTLGNLRFLVGAGVEATDNSTIFTVDTIQLVVMGV